MTEYRRCRQARDFPLQAVSARESSLMGASQSALAGRLLVTHIPDQEDGRALLLLRFPAKS